MLAILNSLNAHNFPIFQLILMILVSKLMVHRALSDKTYLSLVLLSPSHTNFDVSLFSSFQEPVKKRSKLVLPAPQISETELEEVRL